MILRKYHGLGNDYLVLEEAGGLALNPALVRRICDRHRGPGGDGVLEPRPGDGADYGLRIWNPDGSTAEKSGNGLRIFARWLVDTQGAPEAHTVSLPGGVVRCFVGPTEITIEMGRARFEASEVPCTQRLSQAPVDICGTRLRLNAVGMGNPHCVVFCDGPLDALPWRDWGRTLEVHALFPNRTNVQFVRVLSRSRVAARIWERGAGETQASGSSSCAIAAAAVRLGLCDSSVEIEMPGGVLHVAVGSDWAITLRGPVAEIGQITLDLGWLNTAMH
jgi:diaminopimelate epimerase